MRLLLALLAAIAHARVEKIGIEVEMNNVDLELYHSHEVVKAWYNQGAHGNTTLDDQGDFVLAIDHACTLHATLREDGSVQPWLHPKTKVICDLIRPEIVTRPFGFEDAPRVLAALRAYIEKFDVSSDVVTTPPGYVGRVERQISETEASPPDRVAGMIHVTVEIPLSKVLGLWETVPRWILPPAKRGCDLAECFGETGKRLRRVRELSAAVPAALRDDYAGFLTLLSHIAFVLSQRQVDGDRYAAMMHPKLLFGTANPTLALSILPRNNMADAWRVVEKAAERAAFDVAALRALLRSHAAAFLPLETMLLPQPYRPKEFSGEFILAAARMAAASLPNKIRLEDGDAFAHWLAADDQPSKRIQSFRHAAFVRDFTNLTHEDGLTVVNVSFADYVDGLVAGRSAFSDRDDVALPYGNHRFKSLERLPVEGSSVQLEFRKNSMFSKIHSLSKDAAALETPYRTYHKCPSTCATIGEVHKVLAAFIGRLREVP